MSSGLQAERLFTDMCSEQFLRGFVFHSPKFFSPTENEAGDVVLWIRREVVVFEVISRVSSGSSTKQFVKRIGEKRDQLLKDYEAFLRPEITIRLMNEDGEVVLFDKPDLDEVGFSGVVIVDCDDHLEALHIQTLRKSLDMPFPTAIMTRQDFVDLTQEVDTIPDLTYYLRDRFTFLQQVFDAYPSCFLNLNQRLESNLVAFYKMNNNAFPVSGWEPERALGYHVKYTSSMAKLIEGRNAQNEESFVIDDIIELLRRKNHPTDSTLLHSWELASMTRRQRATFLSKKIVDAYDRMVAGNPKRHFAFFNQVTGCWLVFYFRVGGTREQFVREVEQLIRYKITVEIVERGFKFSVFGYGFWVATANPSDGVTDIVLRIEDAKDCTIDLQREYSVSRELFGHVRQMKINEFPDDNFNEPLSAGTLRDLFRRLLTVGAQGLSKLGIGKRPLG
jgi:hypothetical protein